MSIDKEIYLQAENDRYIIETRQLVNRQAKMIKSLAEELDEAQRNTVFAIVLAAASLAFSVFMGLTLIF